MKKVLFLAAAAIAAVSANAQKAKVNMAENAIILQQYDKAKESIDEALQNPKTQEFVKTYIVAAKAYLHLASADSTNLTKAKEFMLKAVELNEKGDSKGKGIGKFTKDINKAFGELSGIAENYAGKAYESC